PLRTSPTVAEAPRSAYRCPSGKRSVTEWAQCMARANTASLGCLAWSWLEAMDDDGVQESGRCWFGVFSGLETVVGPTAFAGRAPARSGPHPGPGELSDRARPHPCQVLRGKKPRRSTTPSGERNWWR